MDSVEREDGCVLMCAQSGRAPVRSHNPPRRSHPSRASVARATSLALHLQRRRAVPALHAQPPPMPRSALPRIPVPLASASAVRADRKAGSTDPRAA